MRAFRSWPLLPARDEAPSKPRAKSVRTRGRGVDTTLSNPITQELPGAGSRPKRAAALVGRCLRRCAQLAEA